MMYYFTDWSGEDCSQGDYPKGWFEGCGHDIDIFTSRSKRDQARRQRLKARIAELKQILKEVGKYD